VGGFGHSSSGLLASQGHAGARHQAGSIAMGGHQAGSRVMGGHQAGYNSIGGRSMGMGKKYYKLNITFQKAHSFKTTYNFKLMSAIFLFALKFKAQSGANAHGHSGSLAVGHGRMGGYSNAVGQNAGSSAISGQNLGYTAAGGRSMGAGIQYKL
jgi:hypothetical protein